MREAPQRGRGALDSLLRNNRLWRGAELGGAAPALPSGFGDLDELLPGGGWPDGGLVELLPARSGIGELRLLLPALARLSGGRRWVAWIDPPYLPYAPALASAGVDLSRLLMVHSRNCRDGFWALEQALRTGTCAAVLAWPQALDGKGLRRLQLAAEAGHSRGFLFREPGAERQSSPAMLRLRLDSAGSHGHPAAAAQCLSIDILKRRGGWPAGPVTLALGCR